MNINLKIFQIDKTHFLKLPLENGCGTLSLLLSITGMNCTEYNNLEYTNENIPDPYKDKIAIKFVNETIR